jgi:hypothetical protein
MNGDRKRSSHGFAFLLLAGSALACSSSGSTGGPGGGTGACEAACQRCTSEICVDCAAAAARYRDEFEGALFACVTNADACSSVLWEGCMAQSVGQAPVRPIDEQFRSACLAKKADCDAQGGSTFADDLCLSSQIFEQGLVAMAQDCVTKSCANAGPCLRTLFP